MSDMEFHNYLDSGGFMVKPNEFRLAIYQGGIEPSLRRVAWRHLLNIYPADMSGRDRFDYMKRKEEEYRKLRDEWREKFRNNTATEEVKYVAGMVKKDVLRTDRSHDFYAGNDENENTLSLFHILVTYALTHPDVSYCQGMSDLASPLLVTQKDEGQAYICFCALMNRLRENFTTEGNAIMTKFRHVSDLLYMYDPVLHSHLVQNSAGDMLFCYRWFLLELKREFPFTDALYVQEVMWATLPPNPPDHELSLVDPDYSSRLLSSSPCSPTLSFQQAMYAKLLAMRRVGALSRVAQSNTSPAVRHSGANQLNIEPSPHFSGLRAAESTVSSFDTSPGDGEDRVADFPEVDNPLTRSMQQKSNSIDQVLQEGQVSEKSENGDSLEELKNNGFVDQSTCNGESIRSDGRQAHADSNNSCNIRNSADQTDKANNGISDHTESFHGAPTENSPEFYSTNASCGPSTGRRDWNVNFADSKLSETPDQQSQFTMSLDSNTNNSEEIFIAEVDQDIVISSTDIPVSDTDEMSMKPELENSDSYGTESNPGLFQSMKRFLASPKRRPFNSVWQDTNASPVSSPKKSSLTNRCVSSAGVSTPVTEKIDGITKNLSDSHITYGQDATETVESSGISCSSNTKSPVRDLSKLPPPHEFGAGNPFLMFVSLTLIIQHRETIISQGMCYEEIAMHFDRLVRRHNANRVLHLARQMYTEYLRAQQANMEKEKEENELRLSC